MSAFNQRQCQGTTQRGTRCGRRINSSFFCHQHRINSENLANSNSPPHNLLVAYNNNNFRMPSLFHQNLSHITRSLFPSRIIKHNPLNIAKNNQNLISPADVQNVLTFCESKKSEISKLIHNLNISKKKIFESQNHYIHICNSINLLIHNGDEYFLNNIEIYHQIRDESDRIQINLDDIRAKIPQSEKELKNIQKFNEFFISQNTNQDKTMPIIRSSNNKSFCCSICLEDEQINGFQLACGHIFHSNCILPCFAEKLKCPNCRTSLISEQLINRPLRPLSMLLRNPTLSETPHFEQLN